MLIDYIQQESDRQDLGKGNTSNLSITESSTAASNYENFCRPTKHNLLQQ